MSNRGALLIARNNGQIDYVKQAVFLANRIKKYLDLPVSLITDSTDYLENNFDTSVFDNIIDIKYKEVRNNRAYFDGTLYYKTAPFKNNIRAEAYNLSPYEETLLLDTDFIISNSILKNCFSSQSNLMMYKNSYDVAKVRDEREFDYISEYTIDFYWATVVFFRKTKENKIFFDLVKHVQEEWNHYSRVYQLNSPLFRNDFAFSIAVHIMNGFTSGDFVSPLPGKHFYTIDKDILWRLDADRMMFLVEKEKYLGEYTALTTKGLNVHVMNKFSLEREIDKDVL